MGAIYRSNIDPVLLDKIVSELEEAANPLYLVAFNDRVVKSQEEAIKFVKETL